MKRQKKEMIERRKHKKIRTESDFPVRMMLKYNDYLISRSYP